MAEDLQIEELDLMASGPYRLGHALENGLKVVLRSDRSRDFTRLRDGHRQPDRNPLTV